MLTLNLLFLYQCWLTRFIVLYLIDIGLFNPHKLCLIAEAHLVDLSQVPLLNLFVFALKLGDHKFVATMDVLHFHRIGRLHYL